MKTAIPVLIGIALAHVFHQCWTRQYKWGEAGTLFYWQATAILLYVFTAWLNYSPPEIPAWVGWF